MRFYNSDLAGGYLRLVVSTRDGLILAQFHPIYWLTSAHALGLLPRGDTYVHHLWLLPGITVHDCWLLVL
jgi:hypothetical protein